MKLQLNKQLTKTKEKTYTYLTVNDDDGTYRADVHTWSNLQKVLEYVVKNNNTPVYFNDTADGYYCLLDGEKVQLYGGRY